MSQYEGVTQHVTHLCNSNYKMYKNSVLIIVFCCSIIAKTVNNCHIACYTNKFLLVQLTEINKFTRGAADTEKVTRHNLYHAEML